MFIRIIYSTKCRECINLLQVIKNEGMDNMFIFVCLDNFTSKQLANLGLGNSKELPIIVVSSQNQPSMIIEGPQKCSQWINNFTMNRRKNIIQQVESRRKEIEQAQATARNQDGGPIEFVQDEMDGISDNYAYNGTDLPQPKNFVVVGNEENYNIRTMNVDDEKLDKSKMMAELSGLEKSRNNESSLFKQMMEREVINAVVNRNGVN